MEGLGKFLAGILIGVVACVSFEKVSITRDGIDMDCFNTEHNVQVLDCAVKMECEGYEKVEEIIDGIWQLCNSNKPLMCQVDTSSSSG